MLRILRIARFGLLGCLALWASSMALIALLDGSLLPLAMVFFLVGMLSGAALPAFALACVALQAAVCLQRRRERRSASVRP